MEHIARQDFLDFFTKPNRLLHARVVHHLLSGCLDCLAEAKRVLHSLDIPASAQIDQGIAPILEEAALLRDEQAKAAVSWARIADLKEQQRFKAIESRKDLRKYGLALYVLDEAELFASRGKVARAAELVRFSEIVLGYLSARVYGAAPLYDLQLRQAIVLCQIRRRELDFVGALAALRRAERVRDSGVALAERARFLRTQASILFDLGELEAAARAARGSASLYEAIRDQQSQGKALLQEASIMRLFDPLSALGLATEGLELLKSPEPKALLSGLFSQCDCLIKLGRVPEAEHLISLNREQVRQLADAGDELWFRYIDALLLKAKGQFQDADAILNHVALRFREEGLYQAMLFQHLERIRIKAETGRWKSAVNIAARLTPELAKLGLRNDLLGMWASLQDALAQRRDVIDEIENLLRKRWHMSGSIDW